MFRRSLYVFVIVLGVIAGCSASTSEVSKRGATVLDGPTTAADGPTGADPGDLPAEYPIDEDVRIGSLDNGLTYYIRSNDNPGGRVELRLAIDAGSVLEQPDQAGAAHFLEHMMFNGTAKYPKNELVELLQSFGSGFGPDINAYTSYDETVYELSLPTETDEVFDTGLDILHEWLTAATLDPQQVTGERGVVLDEWRQSEQTFGGRIGVTIAEMLFDATVYEGRDPIGNDAAISAMTPEPLRRFYDDWYRPDNAALIIVGDIDVDDVEGQIESTFGDATARGANPPRPAITLDSYESTSIGRLVDPETSDALVEVTLPVPATLDQQVSDVRAELLRGIAFDIIANRLNDDETLGETPYSDISVDSNDWVRAIDAPSLLIVATPGGAAASLDLLAVEMERVRRDGVGDAEVSRALAPYESMIRDSYESRNSTPDVDFVQSYLDHFLLGSAIPGASDGYEINQAILETVDAADVQAAFVERWMATTPQVLLVAPEADAASLPADADVLDLWAALADREIEPREQGEASDVALMATLPEPVEERSAEQIDGDPAWYTEPTLLTFENGARVFLNPTDIVEGEIGFQATSPGGLGVVDDADVANASVMAQVAAGSGLGALNAVEVDQTLAGASISVEASLDSISENLYGTAATTDLETLLQVTHLMLTAPRFDDDALADVTDELAPYVADPTIDPEFAAQNTLSDLRYGSEPRMRLLPTAAELATFDTAAMERIWAQRFGNAADWSFALVGDFDLAEATDLARRYIGSLPSTGATETWVDVEPPAPAGIVRQEVLAGSGDKASLTVQLTGSTDGSRAEQALADLLGEVLTNRLSEHIREELGASYSPYAEAYMYTAPDLLIETTISVTGSAADIDRLAVVVQDDLTALRSQGPRPAEWDAAIEAMIQRYGYINNDTIAAALLSYADDPDFDIAYWLNTVDEFDEVTTDDFAEFVTRVLPSDRYIEVRLLPG